MEKVEVLPFEEESFSDLLQESFTENERFEGRVVTGTVLNVSDDYAIVDVGLKSEGRIPLKEFYSPGQEKTLSSGEKVDVFIERYEGRDDLIQLSREKARREESWIELEKIHKEGKRVTGTIFRRVKGGFTVDLSGSIAFLPGSQIDVRPIRDVTPLMGVPQPFVILKMERNRSNIVVSRRAILEEVRSEAKAELVSKIQEGKILEGVIKNITDYGAFIDLGGVDGLLHVTDIAWHRINHPSEVLSVGQPVNVQVIRFDEKTQRISLGMKQLEVDPWRDVMAKYPVGGKFTGRVTNVTDYGAFVELEPGVEGLVHVSEMSWTRKNIHTSKVVSTSQEVEVAVLDVDSDKRRISLGLKQCTPNPWEEFANHYPIGSEVAGQICNITEFGLFIGLPGEIDGMAHLSDLSWDQSGAEALSGYKKGDTITVKVLDINVEKGRVSLGIKQLTDDPFEKVLGNLKQGDSVEVTVVNISEAGLDVELPSGFQGFIRRVDLSRVREEQRSDRFKAGDKLEARIAYIDSASRSVQLSVRAYEIAEERKLMADIRSTSEGGSSLGDVLSEAMKAKAVAVAEERASEEAKKAAQTTDSVSEEEKIEEKEEEKETV